MTRFSRRLRNGPNQPDRQKENRRNQVKHPMHRNAYEPERQKQQPHDRVQKKREQSQRPGNHEKQAPEDERKHLFLSTTDTDGRRLGSRKIRLIGHVK
jgi:hypothetical protein